MQSTVTFVERVQVFLFAGAEHRNFGNRQQAVSSQHSPARIKGWVCYMSYVHFYWISRLYGQALKSTLSIKYPTNFSLLLILIMLQITIIFEVNLLNICYYLTLHLLTDLHLNVYRESVNEDLFFCELQRYENLSRINPDKRSGSGGTQAKCHKLELRHDRRAGFICRQGLHRA